ncbi:ZirU family protein [Pseudomonas sp. TTU2014-080ASC]|uniref:ZirU family protein n=1 Tax=Pseudomonas sp. TTU2014-080ASC TaxID=1729724 RepID=UPI0007187B90|nr:ZirU family protein [Pseudomonas sp. TTU2014-080ASC]KRW58556.1 hypothetical protein AO726_17095 [Pseudomonas sp. TTU2014-080ASC]
MRIFQLNKGRQVLSLLVGMSFTASALAAVTSAPTGTVKGNAPVVVNPAVISFADQDGNGLVNTGDRLSVNWNLASDVSDADGDDVTEAVYQWYAGSALVGSDTELTIQAEHLGQTITVKTLAKTDANLTDPSESLETLAVLDSSIPGVGEGGTEIPVISQGQPLSVTVDGLVDGSPKVGQALTANVVCEGACSGLTYKWQIESSIGSGSFTDIAGATSQTYTPLKGDQKRQVQVIVGP